MFPPALGENRANPGRTARRRAAGALTATALVAAVAGCGGGGRQDENEPSGTYKVDVVTSTFPARQTLAETSQLRLGVENVGNKTVPNLAVTIYTDKLTEGAFSVRDRQPDLADPNRPVWVLESGYPKLAGHSESAGAITAYTDTWAFGPLRPGEVRQMVWKVTASRGGTHAVNYRVSAGLFKAKAVTADGSRPAGKFVVTVSTKPPTTRVTDSGKVVRVKP
jgi:hypothetical protein